MEDFTKSSVSHSHKNSFSKNIKSIIDYFTKLNDEYNKVYNDVEIYRKELANCVDECFKYFKKYDVKFSGNNREDLVNKLLELSDNIKLTSSDNLLKKEFLLNNAKKIENRIKLINELGKKLEILEIKSSKFHIEENDYSDEEKVNIRELREKRKQNKSNNQGIIENMSNDLDDLVKATLNYSENDDYINITMNNFSINDIVLKYYKNSSYWICIYNFEDNKQIIDDICKLNKINVFDAINDKNIFNGYSLKIPTSIKVYEKKSKVA